MSAPSASMKRTAFLRRKAYLLNALSGCCRKCQSERDLQFDCITPRGHAAHGSGLYARMLFYVREFEVGNLQLLCARCHRQKTIEDRRALGWIRDAAFLEEPAPAASQAPAQASLSTASDWEAFCARHRGTLGT